MDGDRVVDGTSYIFFGQAPRDFISILDANRVDMIDMADAGCMSRQNYFRNPIQSPIIVGGVRTTELITFFEVFEFHPQNRGLNSIHPAVPSDHCMVVFSDLAMVSEDSDLVLQLGIVSYNCAGFPECTQVLSGIKAKAGRVTKRADAAFFVFCSVSLTGILDNKKTIVARNLQDRIHICRLTK